MPPTRVIEVAQEVNERLPEALKVDLREPRDPNKVRRELEILVGIVKRSNEVQVPGAPLKRVNGRGPQDPWKSFGKDVFLDQELSTISPPTSPLAAISAIRRKGRKWEADVPMILRSTKLDILEEDDEDDIMEVEEEDSKDATSDEDEDLFRMTKKRRISNSPEDIEMTTPVVHHVEVPLVFKKLFEDVNTSPSPRRTLRAHTQPTVTPDGVFAPSAATNRPLAKPFATDRSFVNTRARYCSSNKISRTQKTTQLGRGQGPFQAPTPKANQRRYHSGSFEKYAIFLFAVSLKTYRGPFPARGFKETLTSPTRLPHVQPRFLPDLQRDLSQRHRNTCTNLSRGWHFSLYQKFCMSLSLIIITDLLQYTYILGSYRQIVIILTGLRVC